MSTSLPAAPVNVHKWGEARYEKSIRNAVRVFIAGQHAGSIYVQDGTWYADRPRPKRSFRPLVTEHPSAEAALKAVLRSGFARELGARAASSVYVTARASKIMGGMPAGAKTAGAWAGA